MLIGLIFLRNAFLFYLLFFKNLYILSDQECAKHMLDIFFVNNDILNHMKYILYDYQCITLLNCMI